MPTQKYLQHVAFAFVAGGLLSYLCVTLLGHAGTLDAKGDACVNSASRRGNSLMPPQLLNLHALGRVATSNWRNVKAVRQPHKILRVRRP